MGELSSLADKTRAKEEVLDNSKAVLGLANCEVTGTPTRGRRCAVQGEVGQRGHCCDSQFPTRMPVDFTLFPRLVPWAISGASSPLSAASAASLRVADILKMMDDDPRCRSSNDNRHALTVALVKPGRGASP